MTEREDNSRQKRLIDSPDEIPEFTTEAEEQAWWEAHDISQAYLRQYRLPADDPILKRLDALLHSQRTGRQSR